MKFFRSPLESTRLVWEQTPLLSGAQATGQKEGQQYEPTSYVEYEQGQDNVQIGAQFDFALF